MYDGVTMCMMLKCAVHVVMLCFKALSYCGRVFAALVLCVHVSTALAYRVHIITALA